MTRRSVAGSTSAAGCESARSDLAPDNDDRLKSEKASDSTGDSNTRNRVRPLLGQHVLDRRFFNFADLPEADSIAVISTAEIRP